MRVRRTHAVPLQDTSNTISQDEETAANPYNKCPTLLEARRANMHRNAPLDAWGEILKEAGGMRASCNIYA